MFRSIMAPLSAASAAAIALTACTATSTHPAPIEERSQAGRAPEVAPAVARPQPPPPVTREAHDGQYLVQAGDTLYSIALAFGQDFRDIARWNGLDANRGSGQCGRGHCSRDISVGEAGDAAAGAERGDRSAIRRVTRARRAARGCTRAAWRHSHRRRSGAEYRQQGASRRGK